VDGPRWVIETADLLLMTPMTGCEPQTHRIRPTAGQRSPRPQEWSYDYGEKWTRPERGVGAWPL